MDKEKKIANYWQTMPLDEAGDMKLAGYRTHAYVMGVPYLIDTGKDKRYMHIGAIVHIKNDDILLELMFKDGIWGNWTLVNKRILTNYFNELNVPSRTHFHETATHTGATIVILEDKKFGERPYIRIKHDSPFNPGYMGYEGQTVKKSTIPFTILGDMVDDYGDWFSIMLVFPNTVKHIVDARNVRQAMLNIRHSAPSVLSCHYEQQIDEVRHRIMDYQSELERVEKDFNAVCENAAAAMNELSERFGIDIDMSIEQEVKP